MRCHNPLDCGEKMTIVKMKSKFRRVSNEEQYTLE